MTRISARVSALSSRISSALFLAVILTAAPFLRASASARISGELGGLRALSDQERPKATIDVAKEIDALPPGKDKVKFADEAANLVTEGDQGHDALQAVADTLSRALKETPVPAKGDQPPMPYTDLARLARYEGVTVSLDDPLYKKANDTLAANEADIAKADFTLKDLDHKSWTLSQLRGKIVLVNFWATWCPPCRAEMPVLDAIYSHYQNEGLVVLSITDESPLVVVPFLQGHNYHPPVLTDTNEAVHNQFHVTGIPKTFVFNRDGKLVGIAIDQSTQKQFFALLSNAGLKPE
jgi:thiol-disulfide isomerase/thioredoxin